MADRVSEHELRYRVGSAGLGRVGVPDAEPHWYCICGGWSVARTAFNRPTRHRAAQLLAEHVRATIEERPHG